MSPQIHIPRSTPEAQGVSSAAISNFVQTIETNIHELHSFMLLRHGQVIAEGWWSPYAAARPHMLFSLSKSFTSTAIGFAVAEGRLSIDDPVLSFFPEEAPVKAGPNLAAMRVRHLLSMSTGHAKDTSSRAFRQKAGNWAKGFLAIPVRYKPGTHFVYNTAATYMLSAIIQKVAGMTLLEYLTPRLFEPLGIENPTWETCPRGINTGGFGLNVRTEDIARFGQLYLQKGWWRGQKLLQDGWVEQATSFQVSNGDNPDSDWNQGYGFQFWRCRHNIYRGDGAFGQYCIVMPDQEAVLAITSGLDDMQVPLNVVWDCLLPAFQDAPLPEDKAAQAQLSQKLSGLEVPFPAGTATSPLAAKVSGKRYKLDANPLKIQEVSFNFSGAEPALTLRSPAGKVQLALGSRDWLEGIALLGDRGPHKVFASGVWSSADTFQVTTRFVETPFIQTLSCRFEGDGVRMEHSINVGFEPNKPQTLVGKIS
jgi:CubicO group peptidase (beta-lactamase class C family)